MQPNYNRTLFKGRINSKSQEGQSLIAGLQDWQASDANRNQPGFASWFPLSKPSAPCSK